jgi:hypothetical protein
MSVSFAGRPRLADVRVGLRFLAKLPGFLRRPVGLAEARAALGRRLERREPDFLDLVRRAVYGRPGSPYHQLLSLAGCEFGDLAHLVAEDGLEGALHTLLRQGVYLTVAELKGLRPAVRGRTRITVEPAGLRNPQAVLHVPSSTSGSRGLGAVVSLDLAFLRDTAVDQALVLAARGGRRWRHAIWSVPGGAGFKQVLKFSACGSPPERWFSQLDPGMPELDPRYRWTTELICQGSALAGVPIPRPLHVPVDDALPIARWVAEVRRAGDTAHIHTFVSSAVRLSQAAHRAGLSLEGAEFSVCGEPITATRLAEIRRAGAEAVPQYGTAETSTIGFGCLSAEAPDEIHLLDDMHAVIQPGDDAGGRLPPRAVLVTSLRATAPLVLLNVCLGDQAVVSRRSCGCPLDQLGWATHAHAIRSYEKLTAGGMTFLDTDLIRVLEEVLPARFGGGSTDYQLEETEAADGRPRLQLIVNPSLGAIDPKAVAEAFLSAIASGSGAERVMGLVWRDAGLLTVARRPPRSTSTGKILHLASATRASAAAAPMSSD